MPQDSKSRQSLAEMALAEMEKLRFEVALENMTEGLCFFDGAQRLIVSNRRYAEIYDLRPEQIYPGITLREVIALRYAAGSCPAMSEQDYHVWRNQVAVAGERSHSVVELTNGRTIRINHQPMPDGGWVATHEDISEHRRREKELRQSQNHLNLAQRVSHSGSVLLDVTTGVHEWSDAFYHLLGIEPDTVPPAFASLLSLIHPDDRARAAVAYKAATTTPLELAGEYRFVRPSGEVRVMQCEAASLSREFGWEGRVLLVFRDVTALRAAEERQRDLERQLQHAQKLDALGTLAGGIAHDLNNTLVPIIALSKMTMRRLAEGSPERESLATVFRAGQRARDLVSQILAFSRKAAPSREPIELGALVQDSLKMLRPSVPATVRICQAVGCRALVLADAAQLHQVIVNLVVNAAQAIGDGKGSITITLVSAGAAHGLTQIPHGASVARLSVADTGCGIDERVQQRIFEPFFTTKPVGEGTGLGLSVVHGIVGQHGGRITVASRIGEGTRFDIYLPALELTESGTERAGPLAAASP